MFDTPTFLVIREIDTNGKYEEKWDGPGLMCPNVRDETKEHLNIWAENRMKRFFYLTNYWIKWTKRSIQCRTDFEFSQI